MKNPIDISYRGKFKPFVPELRQLANEGFGAYSMAKILRCRWLCDPNRGVFPPSGPAIARILARDGIDIRGKHPRSSYFGRTNPSSKEMVISETRLDSKTQTP
jgi:hypothetical protein